MFCEVVRSVFRLSRPVRGGLFRDGGSDWLLLREFFWVELPAPLPLLWPWEDDAPVVSKVCVTFGCLVFSIVTCTVGAGGVGAARFYGTPAIEVPVSGYPDAF